MTKKNKEIDNFAQISIDEFDNMDKNFETHTFSDKYNKRKMEEFRAYKKRMNKVNYHGLEKVAVAAVAALVISSPFAVNALTNGELFNRIWGNEGKKNINSYKIEQVESEKIDDKGNVSKNTITMPKVEYEKANPEKAEKLIGDNVAREPKVIQMGDTKMTVNSVTRDKNGIVAEYTLEKKGGVDCLNYSELDNQLKGAWINEKQDLRYVFAEGSGKIYVDMKKSTKDKLYCYEYMAADDIVHAGESYVDKISDHITLLYYIKGVEEKVEIPVKDEIKTTLFENAKGGKIEISPIAMRICDAKGILSDEDNLYEMVSFISKMEITYKDGSKYLVSQESCTDENLNEIKVDEEIANYEYICGGDGGVITLFNRLVDVSEIEKITVNGTEYTVK